jgi:hypothetical protein
MVASGRRVSVRPRCQRSERTWWRRLLPDSLTHRSEYIRITHDYPLAAAKSFSSLSGTSQFNFVYVSGEGYVICLRTCRVYFLTSSPSADPTEKTYTLFGKIKGRTETALLSLPSTPAYNALRIFNIRPGYVGPPKNSSTMKKILLESVLAPPLRLILPSQVSPTGILSKILVDLATGDGNALNAESGAGIEAGGRTVRCVAIRRLATEL